MHMINKDRKLMWKHGKYLKENKLSNNSTVFHCIGLNGQKPSGKNGEKLSIVDYMKHIAMCF